MASSRQSVRPSQHGFGGRGLGGSAAMQSSKKPLGLGVNEAMLQRRGLIAVGPEDDDDDDEFDWDDEEGAVSLAVVVVFVVVVVACLVAVVVVVLLLLLLGLGGERVGQW